MRDTRSRPERPRRARPDLTDLAPDRSRPLTERITAFSGRHRRAVVLGWLLFVVAAFVGGQAIGTETLENGGNVGETARAEALVDRGQLRGKPSEAVLVQSADGRLRATDPEFRAAVGDVVAALGRFPDTVRAVRSPLAAGRAAGPVSADGHAALVTFEVDHPGQDAQAAVVPVEAAVAAVGRAHPGLRVEQAGDASVGRAFDQAIGRDFRRAELSSLPVTLLILLVAFGSLVAAGIPVLLAITAVLAALGLLAVPSHVWPLSDSTNSVVLLIGMAVGVDYSLFYLRRFREERAAGRPVGAALRVTAATSGRAVVISGLTVMISMAGLFLTGIDVFNGFALGTILVVGVAVAGSLTVLPALVAWLGDRINAGRLPVVGRRAARGGESRLWGALVDRVLRRPLVWGGLATVLLVALALPATGLRTATSGLDGISQDLPALTAARHLRAAFPGNETPAQVVVAAPDVTAPRVTAAIDGLRRRALATGRMFEPVTVTPSRDRTVAVVSVPLAGRGTDAVSEAALRTLRDDLVPSTLGRVPGVETAVTGTTAGNADFTAALVAHTPLVFGFVLGLAFLLLLVVFRSVAIPVTAIVLNLLSVGAAYGVLKLVFQDGHLSGALGFQPIGGVINWLPLFLFVVLFGLSMDYHVFILSRVKEAHDRGLTTRAAVAHGIRSTAGVVTSAGLVMVAVFAIFGTLSLIDLKMLGVGLGAAVLIDMTVVRGVLVPAAMGLLGEANWWLPRWLDWLPLVRMETGASQPPTPATRESFAESSP